jgi:hypothetical protein
MTWFFIWGSSLLALTLGLLGLFITWALFLLLLLLLLLLLRLWLSTILAALSTFTLTSSSVVTGSSSSSRSSIGLGFHHPSTFLVPPFLKLLLGLNVL